MPVSKYNKYFGGNASRARTNMLKQYGSEKGNEVFYATKNKRKKQMKETIKGRMR